MPFINIPTSSELLSNTLASYWIATYDNNNKDFEQGTGVTVDTTNGSIYTINQTNTTYNIMDIIKHDSGGNIEWDKTYGAGTVETPYRIRFRPSTSLLHICGATRVGASGREGIVAQFDTDGVEQWDRIVSSGASLTDLVRDISIDSTGNIYAAVTGGDSSGYIVKWNSTGTIQWQRKLTATSSCVPYSIVVDSSDNIYVAGYANFGSGLDLIVLKYNTAGTIQWQRKISSIYNSSIYNVGGIATDSSGNIYVCAHDDALSGPDYGLLIKYNSTGTIVWQKRFSGVPTSSSTFPLDVAIDSSNNIYTVGYTYDATAGSFQDAFIIKWTSAGAVTWQRYLKSPGDVHDKFTSIAIDEDNDIVVGGTTDSSVTGGDDYILAKLPADGSLTGTHTVNSINYTYASMSLTVSNSSYSDGAAGLTEAAGSLAESAGSSAISTADVMTQSLTDIT